MKRYITIIFSLVVVILTAVTTLSCQQADEVPPRQESTVTTKRYRMPDPVLLTSEEKEEIDAISDEYHQATDD